MWDTGSDFVQPTPRLLYITFRPLLKIVSSQTGDLLNRIDKIGLHKVDRSSIVSPFQHRLNESPPFTLSAVICFIHVITKITRGISILKNATVYCSFQSVFSRKLHGHVKITLSLNFQIWNGLLKMGGVDVAKILPGRSADNKFGFLSVRTSFFWEQFLVFLTVKNFLSVFGKLKILLLKNRIHPWKNPKKYPWKTTLTLEYLLKNQNFEPVGLLP